MAVRTGNISSEVADYVEVEEAANHVREEYYNLIEKFRTLETPLSLYDVDDNVTDKMFHIIDGSSEKNTNWTLLAEEFNFDQCDRNMVKNMVQPIYFSKRTVKLFRLKHCHDNRIPLLTTVLDVVYKNDLFIVMNETLEDFKKFYERICYNGTVQRTTRQYSTATMEKYDTNNNNGNDRNPITQFVGTPYMRDMSVVSSDSGIESNLPRDDVDPSSVNMHVGHYENLKEAECDAVSENVYIGCDKKNGLTPYLSGGAVKFNFDEKGSNSGNYPTSESDERPSPDPPNPPNSHSVSIDQTNENKKIMNLLITHSEDSCKESSRLKAKLEGLRLQYKISVKTLCSNNAGFLANPVEYLQTCFEEADLIIPLLSYQYIQDVSRLSAEENSQRSAHSLKVLNISNEMKNNWFYVTQGSNYNIHAIRLNNFPDQLPSRFRRNSLIIFSEIYEDVMRNPSALAQILYERKLCKENRNEE